MDIYWIKDDRRCGPATVPDVIALVQMGDLTPDTPGWHRGCQGWAPLRTLPALQDFLGDLENHSKGAEETQETPEAAEEAELPPIPGPEAAAEAAPEQEGEQELPKNARRVYLPRPWRRLLARLVDMALYAVVILGALRLFRVPYDAVLTPGHPLFWLPFVFIESYLLSQSGSTPGKALMGIRVLCPGHGGYPVFGQAFRRSLLVFLFGMGLCMPPLSLIMPLVAFFSVRSRGITLWDARSSTLPVEEQKAPFDRCLLAAALCLTSSFLVGLAVQPWIPAMMAQMQRENPAMADTLRKWIPQPQEEAKPAPTEPPAPAPAEKPQDTAKAS